VAPALAEMVNNLPQTARQSPFKTCGTVMVLLPFSGLVIFLPGVLVTDHFLQKLYSAYGSSVEVVVDDGLQMARLGFVMAKLTVRQTYRVVRRQVRHRISWSFVFWVWDVSRPGSLFLW
jgi:hypothetical protein